MSVLGGMSGVLTGAGRREAEEFAAMLESGRIPADHDLADLVALARTLLPVEHAPAADFKAGLRARLVAEAAARAATAPALCSGTQVRTGRPRLRQAVAMVALASVVSGAGAAVASTQALPGDALYGLKRQIEDVQLAWARSDLERGREQLQQAAARLGEAEALAASSTADAPGTARAIATALEEMERASDAGAVSLTDVYRETGDDEPMRLLDRFFADQNERLEGLERLLDPSLLEGVLSRADEIANRARTLLGSAATTVGRITRDATGSGGVTGPEGSDGPDGGPRESPLGVVGGASGGSAATGGSAPTGGAGRSGADLGTDSPGGLATGSGSGSSVGSGASLGSGGTAAPPTGNSAQSPTPAPSDLPTAAPLPTTAPLPTSAPLPSAAPSAVSSPALSPAPAPTCVPVPPLTSC